MENYYGPTRGWSFAAKLWTLAVVVVWPHCRAIGSNEVELRLCIMLLSLSSHLARSVSAYGLTGGQEDGVSFTIAEQELFWTRPPTFDTGLNSPQRQESTSFHCIAIVLHIRELLALDCLFHVVAPFTRLSPAPSTPKIIEHSMVLSLPSRHLRTMSE